MDYLLLHRVVDKASQGLPCVYLFVVGNPPQYQHYPVNIRPLFLEFCAPSYFRSLFPTNTINLDGPDPGMSSAKIYQATPFNNFYIQHFSS